MPRFVVGCNDCAAIAAPELFYWGSVLAVLLSGLARAAFGVKTGLFTARNRFLVQIAGVYCHQFNVAQKCKKPMAAGD